MPGIIILLGNYDALMTTLDQLAANVVSLQSQVSKILTNQEKIMSALTDLQGAEATVAAAVQAAITDIQNLAQQLATLPSVSDADAATITSELNTLATNLNNAVAASQPSQTPTPST